MGRLIDADKLIDHLEKVKNESASLVDMAHIIGFQSVIDAQPTAYDPDKVVQQLEEVLSLADKEKERCAREDPLQLDSAKGYATGIFNALEIVKAGGVDGN